MNIKDKNKINILSDTLAEFFGKRMNLARIMFFNQCFIKICDSFKRVSNFLKFIRRQGFWMKSQFTDLTHKPVDLV